MDGQYSHSLAKSKTYYQLATDAGNFNRLFFNNKKHKTMETTTKNKNNFAKTISNAFGKDQYLLGIDAQGVKYWLSAPSWDCGWYWGFGYVSTFTNNNYPNKSRDINSHEHIDSSFMGKQDEQYIHNIFDSPRFTRTTFSKSEGWELSELFDQFYFLKSAAENFGRGKCHIAETKIQKWQDKALAEKINKELIPRVTARIIEILS